MTWADTGLPCGNARPQPAHHPTPAWSTRGMCCSRAPTSRRGAATRPFELFGAPWSTPPPSSPASPTPTPRRRLPPLPLRSRLPETPGCTLRRCPAARHGPGRLRSRCARAVEISLQPRMALDDFAGVSPLRVRRDPGPDRHPLGRGGATRRCGCPRHRRRDLAGAAAELDAFGARRGDRILLY